MKIHALILLLVTSLFARADEVQTLIKSGDDYEAKLQTQPALQAYLAAEKIAPNDVKVLCAVARGYAEAMSDTTSTDEKLALGNKALEHAQRAVKLDPKSDTAQISVAICYGRLAPLLPNKTQVSYSKLIKDAADRALKLNPKSDVAWYVLGEWNYGVADLNPLMKMLAKMIYDDIPDASFSRAEVCLKKAIAINPTRPSYFIELGRTQLKLGEKAEAKTAMTRGYAMPDLDKDDVFVKQRARKTFDSL